MKVLAMTIEIRLTKLLWRESRRKHEMLPTLIRVILEPDLPAWMQAIPEPD